MICVRQENSFCRIPRPLLGQHCFWSMSPTEGSMKTRGLAPGPRWHRIRVFGFHVKHVVY